MSRSTVEFIAEFIADYYAAWQPDNADELLSYFSERALFEDLAFEARFVGLAEIKSFIELTYSGIPDFRVSPTHIVAGEGGAAAQWVMRGTHSGDLPGMPATGRSFEVRASSLVRLESNLITGIYDYWNPETFKKSVGLL